MQFRNSLGNLVPALTCLMLLVSGTKVYAVPTLTALATFGNGDGWREPGENLSGDLPGLTDGSGFYKYLQVGNLERGMAYNPVSGNLVLVSRSSAGNGIRILNGTTGDDVGALNQGSGIIAGGDFTTNMVGVAGDGVTYVSNLKVAADTGNFKIYKWADSQPATTPSVFYAGAAITGYSNGTPRLGDSLDVMGSGATTKLVAGVGPNSGVNPGPTGYTVFDASGVPTTVGAFGGSPDPTGGDFRLGITFAGSANDVWGKQASQNLEVTSYSGSTGTSIASVLGYAAGEAPMDYAVIAGTPVLALVDANSSLVRVYNVTDPAAPTLLVSATTTAGTLAPNGNGTGSLKFGAISGNTATIYAMSTNQGIQALQLTLDPPAGVPGDYNGNGVVDAADYVLWRNGGPLQNEVDTPGTVNAQDYTEWRARFGNTSGSGSGFGSATVPEPGTLASLMVLVGSLGVGIRRR